MARSASEWKISSFWACIISFHVICPLYSWYHPASSDDAREISLLIHSAGHLIHLVTESPSAVGVLCLAFAWVTNIFTLCGHFKVPATYLSPHPLVTDFLMVWFPGLDYLDKLLAISLKSLWIFSFVHISFQTNRIRYSAHWEDSPPPPHCPS